MQADSLISVIIPVYNGERYLGEALRSVRAQDYPAVEIIVVDDGSTDGTNEIARGCAGVKYHWQARQGPGVARNTGVAMAGGAFLAFLDADDLWEDEKLSRQMSVLNEESELEAVYSYAIQFSDESLPAAALRPRPAFFPGAMLVRRTSFARVGNFATEREIPETIDWHLKALEAGLRYRILPDVLYRRRVHSSNRGRLEPNLQGYVQSLKHSLDRRQARSQP